MIDTVLNFSQIILADLILSGDNALIIGMAAAGLPPNIRRRAILFGMISAALLRIIFAVIATKLLGIPGLLFFGGMLLLWVCWQLYKDLRNSHSSAQTNGENQEQTSSGKTQKTLKAALISIAVADVSMSLDNVLAVAAIADGHIPTLVFGLSLAILLMAFAATIIMHILAKYPWIAWLGLVVLLYVASEMLFRGVFDQEHGIGPMLGLFDGMELKGMELNGSH